MAKAAADALMVSEGRSFAAALKRAGLVSYAGVIADDAAIVSLTVRKRWSPAPGGARLVLRDTD